MTGNSAIANSANGVQISDGASNNTIGGSIPGQGDVISGNSQNGVYLTDSASLGNVIADDTIGLNVTGTVKLGNGFWGVLDSDGAATTIGGISGLTGNLVSGNDQGGVAVFGSATTGSLIAGNIIGLGADGSTPLGNGYSGVYVGDFGTDLGGANGVTVGGTNAGARNVISANGNWGVWLPGPTTTNDIIDGNYIGTDVTGTQARGNSYDGIQIAYSAYDNTIGGTASGAAT